MNSIPIIDAQTGHRIKLSSSIFMNELLLDVRGRKVSPESIKSKSYYYSVSLISDGRTPNPDEIRIAMEALEKYLRREIVNTRSEIVSLHQLLKEKMRTYKRYIFIIRTHPLFEKVKTRSKIFVKLTKLVELPLKGKQQKFKKYSEKFKRDETTFNKMFPKKKEKTILEKSSHDDEESEGEVADDNDFFVRKLREHDKDQKKKEKDAFSDYIDDDEDDILMPMDTDDEEDDEEEEPKKDFKKSRSVHEEEEEEEEEDLLKNLKTPTPVQSDNQKKISKMMDGIYTFEKHLRNFKKIREDAERSDFKTHVPVYIYALLEEIRRRERVLRSFYYKLSDLQSSLERENLSRETFFSSGIWKRKKDYKNPTEEEEMFLGERIGDVNMSQFLDPRYYDLFSSSAEGSGAELDDLISPLTEEEDERRRRERNNNRINKKKTTTTTTDIGLVSTEDLIECLRLREAEIEEKDEEIAEKEKKIKKLGRSLGETQVSHDLTKKQAEEYEGMISKLNETMFEKEKGFEGNLEEERRRLQDLETQNSQMEAMYNQKIEDMTETFIEEKGITDKKISELEEKIKKSEIEKKNEIQKLKKEEISKLESEIELKMEEILKERERTERLSESILIAQSSESKLQNKVSQLTNDLEKSIREAGEVKRKAERGEKFVEKVVRLVGEKNERIVVLEEFVSRLVKKIQFYHNKQHDVEEERKKKENQFKHKDDFEYDDEDYFLN